MIHKTHGCDKYFVLIPLEALVLHVLRVNCFFISCCSSEIPFRNARTILFRFLMLTSSLIFVLKFQYQSFTMQSFPYLPRQKGKLFPHSVKKQHVSKVHIKYIMIHRQFLYLYMMCSWKGSLNNAYDTLNLQTDRVY